MELQLNCNVKTAHQVWCVRRCEAQVVTSGVKVSLARLMFLQPSRALQLLLLLLHSSCCMASSACSCHLYMLLKSTKPGSRPSLCLSLWSFQPHSVNLFLPKIPGFDQRILSSSFKPFLATTTKKTHQLKRQQQWQ